MSGNPFRTSPQQNQAAIPSTPTISIIDGDSSRAEAPQLGTDSVHASPLPAKTKKSVRIESPTTSASHPGLNDGNDAHEQRKTRGHHAGSPPLTVHAGFSDNFSDQVVETPFNKDADNDEDGRGGWGLIGSTRKNTGMGSPAPSQISSGAPANPFSKTLATIEPQEKGTAERRDHLSDRSAAEKAGSGNTKTSLDVEGFKRLLMTGISNPTSPVSPQPQMATAPNHINPSIFESSSSTDTSSISRQSIFEPVQDTHGETPRTSYEMAASDDEEKTGLIGDVRKTPKKKPPPPKHRHGNLVTHNRHHRLSPETGPTRT
ncbi:uncharacterized protein BDR25DRAFT_74859 [Lindgomyces ingoldianus]|uniref:Uncharacterized protein n=1 Tax=Lindgomyces ingoldianus TaxID=673940 RepID=A0ACB6QIS1_9PLEO|nr:uncharacterized protein BDR25DRAFT_74859 [Lindgomyces ingoldianus]KAF2466772.1 hypothetical protein BDR25DRAFT_74859 [Lindgomyces ingoldianus]